MAATLPSRSRAKGDVLAQKYTGLDLYSGSVVSWSMSHSQARNLIVQIVLMVLWQRDGQPAVVLHPDRGY